MAHDLKEEMLDLLADVPPMDVTLTLEEPPSESDFCTCPHCGFPGVETWSTSQAYVVNCPECHMDFKPVLEGMKHLIVTINEKRRQALRRGRRASAKKFDAKKELLKTLE